MVLSAMKQPLTAKELQAIWEELQDPTGCLLPARPDTLVAVATQYSSRWQDGP